MKTSTRIYSLLGFVFVSSVFFASCSPRHALTLNWTIEGEAASASLCASSGDTVRATMYTSDTRDGEVVTGTLVAADREAVALLPQGERGNPRRKKSDFDGAKATGLEIAYLAQEPTLPILPP